MKRRLLVATTALIALVLTLAAWHAARRQAAAEAATRFEFRVDEIATALRGRVLDYEQLLRGAVGLFAASGTLDEGRWAAYFAALRLEGTYGGIRAMGYAPWDGATARVLFVAPQDAANLAARGYDMYSEPARRTALESARDSGEPALTGRVTLAQEAAGEAGALLYLAVYRPGARLETVRERRAALAGFVYLAFRIADFVHATVGETPGIGVRLVDVTAPQPEALYDDGTPPELARASKEALLGLRGRTWRLEAGSFPGFAAGDRPQLVLAGGLALTLVLTMLVWSLLNTRAHARELARRILAASEELERFRAAVDRHGDSMLMVDAGRMRIVYANEGACRNLGYRRDELIGQSPELIFADRDGERLAREYGELARDDGGAALERALHRRKDGSTFPVEISREIVRNRSGMFVLGIARDISARLAAERALRETGERLELALEATGLAIFDWDLRTGLVHLGSRWAAIVGGEPMAVLQPIQELEALVHPDDLGALRDEVRRLLAGEVAVYRVEHRVRTRSGDWKWIESVARVSERDAAGRALRVVGTNADISERRALDALKNEFIASVSHELRTPLSAIVASLGLLKEGSAGELPEEARGFVDMAHANSERLAALINDLLDLERVESGRLRLAIAPVDAVAVLRQAAELNAPYAERYKARIEVRAAGAPLALADAHRLLQVLANLISNAAKFSPPGGRIALSLEGQGSRVVLRVSDEGPGVPAEFRARLFGKFEQADPSKPGTGLGLAICKALVEKMAGRIRYEPAEPRGATFVVELPAA